MTPEERRALAHKRLRSVLTRQVVASARTLEQKISDAGPFGQRIDPHVLTPARRDLEQADEIRIAKRGSMRWYSLTDMDERHVAQKLGHLEQIHTRANKADVRMRVGQALEIAVFRALRQGARTLDFFGHYEDIDRRPDSTLYTKREPPNALSGRALSGKKNLDFLVSKDGITGGVEVKNVREWLYPDRDEVRALLAKCAELDVVPVLIARRLPFVTFKLLNACGVIVHETYRQHYPAADAELVADLKDKRLFGFHDIALGNAPDARLTHFLHDNLPGLLARMRPTYDAFQDLSLGFATGELSYAEFSARVRRRTAGVDEDHD